MTCSATPAHLAAHMSGLNAGTGGVQSFLHLSSMHAWSIDGIIRKAGMAAQVGQKDWKLASSGPQFAVWEAVF